MKKKIAKIISRIFGPFTCSPILFLILCLYSYPLGQGLEKFVTYFAVLYIIPALYIIWMVKTKRADAELSDRRSRPIFFTISTLTSIAAFFLAYYILNEPRIVVTYFLAVSLFMFVFTFITFFWKISIHVAFVTILTFYFAWLFNKYFLFLGVFIPLVAWARYYLKLHSIFQMIAGFLVSVIVTFLTFYLLNYLYIYD